MSSLLAEDTERIDQITRQELVNATQPVLQRLGINYQIWGSIPGSKTYEEFIDALLKRDIEWEWELGTLYYDFDSVLVKLHFQIGTSVRELRKLYDENLTTGKKSGKIQYAGFLWGFKKGTETAYQAAIRCLGKLQPDKQWAQNLNKLQMSFDRQDPAVHRESVHYPGFMSSEHRRTLICTTTSGLMDSEQFFIDSDNTRTYYAWHELTR